MTFLGQIELFRIYRWWPISDNNISLLTLRDQLLPGKRIAIHSSIECKSEDKISLREYIHCVSEQDLS